jgi:hypothetical protein
MVNSVWLWGGGTDQKRRTPAATIFADQGRVRDLARGSAIEVAPVPAEFDALPRGEAAEVWLAPIDADHAIARLAAIDRMWVVPMARALSAGSLRAVELVLGGRQRALRFTVGRISFAQRLRARLAPPRLSQMLAQVAGAG